jgi:dynein intermediate chain 1
VWEVRWQNDDLDEHSNFISVSSDGRVTQWTLLKNELLSTDIMHLRKDGSSALKEEDPLFSLMSGTCFDVSQTDPDIFIVGTDDGKIFKCSKAFNNQYLLTFEVCYPFFLPHY